MSRVRAHGWWLPVVCLFPTLACSGPDGVEENIDAVQEPALGNVFQTVAQTGPFVRAVAVLWARSTPNVNAGICTATLFAPNKILTARHCFCNGVPTNSVIQFADDSGTIPTGAPEFPITSVELAPAPGTAGDEFCQDNQPFVRPFDLAVATIGPSTATGSLPAVTPVKAFIGNPFFTGPRLAGQHWVVGYGGNVPMNVDTPVNCLGCGTRRAGNIGVGPQYLIDECNGDPDCWETRMWVAPSVEGGATAQISGGDSGGPLFFNINNATQSPVVAGVCASFAGEIETAQRWAATGWIENAQLIWKHLGSPFERTAAQQRAQTALFGRIDGTFINDRARVIEASNGQPAEVLSGNNARLGADARSGTFLSIGNIELADRSLVTGDAKSSMAILRGNSPQAGRATGAMLTGEFIAFEDQPPLTIPVPTTPMPKAAGFTLERGERSIAPGPWGPVTVRANARLVLQSSGLYVFDSLILESFSTLVAPTFVFPATWLFVQSGPVILRGTVIANANRMFIGAPTAGVVNIGAAFFGTVVAPNAQIAIENTTLQVQQGSVFGRRVELHQGLTWRHSAFFSNWVPQCSTFAQCN